MGRNDARCPPLDVPPGGTGATLKTWEAESEGGPGELELPRSGTGSNGGECPGPVSVTGSVAGALCPSADAGAGPREATGGSRPTQDATSNAEVKMTAAVFQPLHRLSGIRYLKRRVRRSFHRLFTRRAVMTLAIEPGQRPVGRLPRCMCRLRPAAGDKWSGSRA